MPQTLIHSPAAIIRKLLIDEGLGSDGDVSNWPVHYALEPSAPDNCITVKDTAGTGSGRAMVTGELFGHAGFQIRIRSGNHSDGWLKADAIQTHLAEEIDNQTVTMDDGTVYHVPCISGIGDVLVLGKESPSSSRRIFTLNAKSAIETYPL